MTFNQLILGSKLPRTEWQTGPVSNHVTSTFERVPLNLFCICVIANLSGVLMAEETSQQDLIVFDGLCVFCSSFARFMVKHDKQQRFKFVTAQSDVGRALYHQYDLDPDLMETNIIILDGVPHTRMRSFTAAMRGLGAPWSWLQILNVVPRPIADWVYDRIARNRYRFGRRDCLLPSDELRNRLID